jgi:hypothetical protein
MNRILALVAVAVCLFAALPLAGCESKVSDENFDRITAGMTRDQVEAFMGEGQSEDVGGVSISGAGIAGGSPVQSTTKTFSWKDGQKQIIVVFKDDKVDHKSKLGF